MTTRPQGSGPPNATQHVAHLGLVHPPLVLRPRLSPGYGDLMDEERLLAIGVECYAGHRGEQTPRTLIVGGRRIAVADLLDAWLAPDYRYFKVRGADGDTYLVRHDERSNTWELTMFRAEQVGE
jgi:hypothetical protein